MSLNIIDFSNGIRPEEIQDNFENLQAQINRERLSIGGTGIAQGLNLKFIVDNNLFQVVITSGSIINKNGEEVFIEGKTLDVEPPELHTFTEYLTLTSNKTVTLRHIPYAVNRRCPSESLRSYEPEYSGIEIHYRYSKNLDDYIRVRDIQDKVLTISGANSDEVRVDYFYTAKRIDAVYIDANHNIKINKGTTSTTPSYIYPVDAELLLAYIEIDDSYVSQDNIIPHANIYVKDDLRDIRNVYTDNEGRLYINGTPFDDLQIIHLQEPKNPKPNTLWLNPMDNTLYYWQSTDEFVYRNDIHIDEYIADVPEIDLVFGTHLSYILDSGELSVYLNGSKLQLNRDYEEVIGTIATAGGNTADEVKGNAFRILNTIQRPDGLTSVPLQNTDVITYMITFKDSQYMWVPLNKTSYINAKNIKVYSTWFDDIKQHKDYLFDNGTKSYFDSTLANSLDENRNIEEENYYPYKYQYFFFERENDLKMLFTPGRNELSIMVNQVPLHEDQFEEISVHDINKLPSTIQNALRARFGWTEDYIAKNYIGENSYDNSGIGFVLIEPLDAGSYAEEDYLDKDLGKNRNDYTLYDGSNNLFVEASVQKRIVAGPINRKLERTATFVLEDIIEPSFIDGNNIVTIPNGKYGFGENQLEVFKNGIKLINGKDYKEEFGYLREIHAKDSLDEFIWLEPIEEIYQGDYPSYYYKKKGHVCTKFQILNRLTTTDKISFRITTNIYSYDHVNSYMDRLLESSLKFDNQFNNLSTLMRNKFDSMTFYIDDNIENINSDLNELEKRLPNEKLIENSIKSLEHIKKEIEINVDTISVEGLIELNEDIFSDDYVQVSIRRHILISDNEIIIDNILSPESEFIIRDDGINTYLSLNVTVLNERGIIINPKDLIIISGLKTSKQRVLGEE